jgi:dipeptidyl aminopeptidase/acylaminoacyl peptidase
MTRLSGWFVVALALAGCSSGPSTIPLEPVPEPADAAEPEPATASYLDQLPPLIDREVFFGDPEISGAQISPDGQWITFRKPYNEVMNIWVKGVDAPFDDARPITADTVRPVRGYFWSQDSEYVLYVQDKGGDENFHVYAVDPAAAPEEATGVPPARDLTPYEGIRATIVSVPEATPKRILVGLNDRDARYHDVYEVDLETGDRELLIQNDEQVAGWQADLDGRIRMGVRVDDEGATHILRVDDDVLTEVYQCGAEEDCGPVRFHKDGRRVYMVTNKGDDVDLVRLVLFDPASGNLELVESDPEGEVDFGGAEFSDDTDELVATYYVGDRLRIYPKDDDFAHHYERLRELLPRGDIYLGSSTEDESKVIVTVTSDVDPGATYLYDREAEEAELLYRPRAELPTEHLAEMRPVRYPARDGEEVPAYLTVPKGVDAEGLPAIILPHGGPWARDAWGYDGMAQWLANRGYVVLQPNFRASTGYGKRWLNLGNKEWGTGTMQHDLSDGVAWLVEEGIADPDQVCIMGGSYGGYATLAGLAFTPELYHCGVSIVGPSNLITLIQSVPPYWEPLLAIFRNRMGDWEDPEERAMLERQSPLHSAEQIEDPLLVIQGANDPRVNKAESDQIVVAMRDLGREVEYMVAPDEGHGFAGEMNRLAMIAEIEAFLAEHLGGRYQEEMSPELRQHLEGLMVDVGTVTVSEPEEEENAGVDMSVDPALVTPGAMAYALTMAMGGQTMELSSERSVERGEWEGREAWVVVETTRMPNGAGMDSTWVDPATLRPIARHIHQGQAAFSLDFTDEGVTGVIEAGPRTMDVDVASDEPVFGDGASLNLAIGAMPLEPGYVTTLQRLDLRRGTATPVRVEVTGTENVEVGGGRYEAFVVEVRSPDTGDASTLWIDRESRRVVKAELAMGPQMGGATAVLTLTQGL